MSETKYQFSAFLNSVLPKFPCHRSDLLFTSVFLKLAENTEEMRMKGIKRMKEKLF